MSVLAKDRKQSELQVMTHWMDVRIECNRLIVFNFGYEKRRVIQAVRNEFNIYESTDKMKPKRLETFKQLVAMNEKAALEILEDSRKIFLKGFREVEEHMFIANTIYPTTSEELSLRRCHQDEALGICYAMLKELEFIMRSMPVNSYKLERFVVMLNDQIALLKAWRSSNNRFNVNGKSSKRQRSRNGGPGNSPKHNQSGDALPGSDSGDPSNPSQNGNSTPQATESATVTTPKIDHNAASGNKQPYSKGWGYSTGYRQPNR